MNRALPELLARKPTAWEITGAPTGPHEPTATPHKKRARADTEPDQAGELSRLVALVASRHNTKRPDTLIELLQFRNGTGTLPKKEMAKRLHAMQELRNRTLAHRTPTGQNITPSRYHLPEQIAGHHATSPGHPEMLDIVAMINNRPDLATYLATLTKHSATELAETVTNLVTALDMTLNDLATKLATGKRSRYWHYHNGHRISVNDTERTTCQLVEVLLNYEQRAERAHKADQQTKKRKQAKTQQARQMLEIQQRAGNTTPPDSYDPADWLPVIPNKPPREITHTGRLGRRKISTNTGKNPNRIHNYYGDPARRIFSRTTRGTKALVLVDASGSMDLSTDDLEQIMKASAGATVIAYSASDNHTPNTHLLAHHNRRVRHLPHFAGGNGIDAPALIYALKNYREQHAPVLWITDGKATGRGGNSHRHLRHTCSKLAQKHGVHLAPDIQRALTQLEALKNGQRPQRWPVFE